MRRVNKRHDSHTFEWQRSMVAMVAKKARKRTHSQSKQRHHDGDREAHPSNGFEKTHWRPGRGEGTTEAATKQPSRGNG